MRHAAVQAIESFLIAVSEKTNWILLEVRTDDGVSGFGEATCAGAVEGVLAEIGHVQTLVVGKRLRLRGEVLSALRQTQISETRLYVLRALEQACLVARRAGIALAEFLGGPARTTVPVYANINRGMLDRSPSGFAARARAVVTEDGYKAVKIAPFDGLEWSRVDSAEAARLLAKGIERIAAVRDAIGPEVGLLVDCHSRLSPVMARTVLREAGKLRLFWLTGSFVAMPAAGGNA